MKTCLLISLLLMSLSVQADSTDIDMKKLKNNMEKSEENLQNLSLAVSTAKDNVKKYSEAINQLGQMKEGVEKNSKVAVENQKLLQTNYEKLDQLILEENKRIGEEDKYIQQLKEKIQQAEQRQLQRRQNLTLYETKKSEIVAEKNSWQSQKDNVKSIVSVIEGKQKVAESGFTKWQAELKGLSAQEKEWSQQARQSKDVYKKVKTFKERNQ